MPPALLGVGFLARALVQATLPHSDPKANEFVRRNEVDATARLARQPLLADDPRFARTDLDLA